MGKLQQKLLAFGLVFLLVLSLLPTTMASAVEMTDNQKVGSEATEIDDLLPNPTNEIEPTEEDISDVMEISTEEEPKESDPEGTAILQKTITVSNTDDQERVDQAVAAIDGKLLRPKFEDKEIFPLIKNLLKNEGFEDVVVTKMDPKPVYQYPIGDFSEIDEQGRITKFFFADPDSNVFASNAGEHRRDTNFTLTKGEATAKCLIKIFVPWDESKVKEIISSRIVDKVNFESVLGDQTADQVVSNFNLPYHADGKLWCDITWASSDPTIVSIGEKKSEAGDYVGRNAYFPVTVKRSGEDKQITLTATYAFNKSNGEHIKLTKQYNLTVKAIDLSEIEDTMRNDLDKYFVPEVLTYSGELAGQDFDANNVLGDFTLPRSGKMGRDTKDKDGNIVSHGIKDLYKKYQTSGLGFSFYDFDPNRESVDDPEAGIFHNSFAAKVKRPVAGEKPLSVDLTMTLRHKEYDLQVSKTLKLTLNPIDHDQFMTKVDRYARLMELAKANWFEALNRNGNEAADQITKDLGSVKEIRFRDGIEGTEEELEFIYNAKEVKGDGIVPQELPGWESQESWRLFRSSRPDLLSHETLRLVKQPKYNTEVTVDSVLTVPALESYREYFSNNPNTSEAKKLASLFDQPIKLNVKIIGTDGEAPEGYGDQITGTFIVNGSKLIHKKEDHATANEEWLRYDFEVEPGTTLGALTRELLAQEGRAVKWSGGMLTSITIDGKTNTNQITNGVGSYWMWYLNNELGPVMADSYVLQTDDKVEWRFDNDPSYPSGVVQETSDPPHTVDATPDYWPGFAAADNNNATKDFPKVEEILNLEWGKEIGEIDSYGTNYKSDFLVVKDHIFLASDDLLYKIDYEGNIVAQTSLRADILYFSRLAYNNGLIVVPLKGGALQAIDPVNMQTVWVASSLDYYSYWDPEDNWNEVKLEVQNLSTTYIDNGIAYSATAAPIPGGETAGGYLRAVDMTTGETLWLHTNREGGYYWSGPIKIDDWLLIAGDDGMLQAFEAKTGALVASQDIGSKVRSTLVRQGNKIYFTTYDGHLVEVTVNTNSGISNAPSENAVNNLHFALNQEASGGGVGLSFGKVRKVKFALKSTSTPTIKNGKAYVGGLKEGGWPGKGVFAVIDIQSDPMKVIESYTTVGEVKSTPLVLTGKNGKTIAYFTANNDTGELLSYSDGKVVTAYTPGSGQRQYTTSSPVVTPDGVILYNNDSGYVFALQGAAVSKDPVPTNGTEEGTEPTSTEPISKPVEDAKPTTETISTTVEDPEPTDTVIGEETEGMDVTKESELATDKTVSTPKAETKIDVTKEETNKEDVPRTGEKAPEYVVGSIIVAAALILLVGKKKYRRQ